MLVATFPWHFVGILGMPRRMAYFDYSHSAVAPQAIYVTVSVIGGLLLLASAVLFVLILVRGHLGNHITLPEFRFSMPVHATTKMPAALNGFSLWLALMIGLTVVNYGYPIGQLMALNQSSVPAVPIVVK
jgi:cytochrome c oxidase subunit 1